METYSRLHDSQSLLLIPAQPALTNSLRQPVEKLRIEEEIFLLECKLNRWFRIHAFFAVG